MEVQATLETRAGVDEVFGWVDDLSVYPEWLDIVDRAEPTEAVQGDAGPAWMVELTGRVGPLARSKRLRMVRSELVVPECVVFERCEDDGRRHAPWELRAQIREVAAGSALTMTLSYGGRLWAKPLELLLRDEIERSRVRLLGCLETG